MTFDPECEDKSVILISPNVMSIYSSTVASGLIKKNVKIRAIVVVRLLNIKRILKELERNKYSLLDRVFKKVLFRKHTMSGKKNHKQVKINLNRIARDNNIPIHYVDSVNSLKVESILQELNFSTIVFTGGGIINSNILKLAKNGVINCHSGILPYYRGMDCHKWAILNNELDKIGVSCHFMVEKVDRGDLLNTRQLRVCSNDTLKEIEEKLEHLMSMEIVDITCKYLNGKILPKKQNINMGKNYYSMHKLLENFVKRKLACIAQ